MLFSAVLLLIAAFFYFLKSFKESKCVPRRSKKHAYVQTGLPTGKPQYVQHSIQGPVVKGAYPQPTAAHGYQSLGHSSPVQPPDYRQAVHGQSGPYSEPPASSYYPPPPDPRSSPSTSREQGSPDPTRPQSPPQQDVRPKSPEVQSDQRQSKKARPSLISRTESQERSNTPEPDTKSIDSDSSEKAKSSRGEGAKSPSEGSFKLFGLLKKEEKPKEEPVAMVSSQRSLEEDEEQYPEGKNPFEDDDEDNMSDGGQAGFEWDPNNRG